MNKSILAVTVCALGFSACASTVRYLQGDSLLYRELHIDTWVETGGDIDVIEKTLEKIKRANSDAHKNLDKATKDYGPGNWEYEWDSVAKEAVAKDDYFAATAYYTIAGYPFIQSNELSNQSYDLALINYETTVMQEGSYIEKLTIPTTAGFANAYLHLPVEKPKKKLPVLVVSNGSDQTLTTLYPVYRDFLKPKGWAMISLDLPGIGSNRHIGITTSQTNLIHQHLLKRLKLESRIDSDKIALMGSSFAGNAIVKTAFTNPDDIAAVVSICGAVDTPFKKLKFALTQVPKMTGESFLSRFTMSREEVIDTSNELALSTHYLGKMKTSVPILSLNHDDDLIAPPKDMKLTAQSSTQGDYIILDKGTEYGHCPSDAIALPLAMNWLEEVVL